MGITALRSTDTRRIARRSEDRATRLQLADAIRTCAELQTTNTGLERALEIVRFENTRLAQEIAALRRALRMAEQELERGQP